MLNNNEIFDGVASYELSNDYSDIFQNILNSALKNKCTTCSIRNQLNKEKDPLSAKTNNGPLQTNTKNLNINEHYKEKVKHCALLIIITVTFLTFR